MTAFNSLTTGEEVVKNFVAETEGKTIIITGPSEKGIGAETAISLAHGSPKALILAGRSESKISPVIEKIKTINSNVEVKFLKLDLCDPESIRSAASELQSLVSEIDVLINNAGILAVKDYITTKFGAEIQFTANHLGPFLFTNLVMPKILASAEKGRKPRIINVTSLGYELENIRYDDYNFEDGKSYHPWKAYGQSKTGNVLFTQSLAQKLKNKGVLSFVLHPGLILESHLLDNVPPESFAVGSALMTERNNGVEQPVEPPKSLQAGCATTLVAALDPALEGSSGAFLRDCNIMSGVKEYAIDQSNAERLWKLSEKIVGEEFSY